MPEQQESLTGMLSRVNNIEQLRLVLPPTITEKLGKGKAGLNKTIGLLTSLTPFAPEPATFDRDAFNNIVAVDYDSGEPLPGEEQQKMLDVALEAGFVQRAETTGERYSVKKELQDAIKKAVGEE